MSLPPYDPDALQPLQQGAACYPNYPARCGNLDCCATGSCGVGSTGPTGPPGPQGTPGPTGAAGTTETCVLGQRYD